MQVWGSSEAILLQTQLDCIPKPNTLRCPRDQEVYIIAKLDKRTILKTRDNKYEIIHPT